MLASKCDPEIDCDGSMSCNGRRSLAGPPGQAGSTIAASAGSVLPDNAGKSWVC